MLCGLVVLLAWCAVVGLVCRIGRLLLPPEHPTGGRGRSQLATQTSALTARAQSRRERTYRDVGACPRSFRSAKDGAVLTTVLGVLVDLDIAEPDATESVRGSRGGRVDSAGHLASLPLVKRAAVCVGGPLQQ